ncbi:MAG: EamA family transporter, partial [Alphaproteobacteria bacterium]|nr:EamA family transporter [Alphaproteobacteria bacterium]
GLLFLAAAGWGMGNVVLGRLGKIDLAGIVAWMSLAAVVPFGLLSLIFEGPTVILASFVRFDWTTVVSVLVISVLATVVAYGGWAYLIRHYGVVEVSPYSLLVPVSGVLSGVLILGERMDGMRASGIVLILVGLGVHSLWSRFRKA